MGNSTNLTNLQTNELAPVDLNTILYMNEQSLASFHSIFGQHEAANYYLANANKRELAIQKFLTHRTSGGIIWRDYNYVLANFTPNIYEIAFLPAWAGLYDTKDAEIIVAEVHASITNQQLDGVPTSFIQSGQQWDFPNEWAPLQYFMIKIMDRIARDERVEQRFRSCAESVMQNLVQMWTDAVYCGWQKYQMMFEKYNVTKMGEPGGGGQYLVQHGFGWTNGVTIHLLAEYSKHISSPSCGPYQYNNEGCSMGISH